MTIPTPILWDFILEDAFKDILRFFYPEATTLFNMRKGALFIDDALAGAWPEGNKDPAAFISKVAKLYRRDGTEELILLHVDTGVLADDDFTRRMFAYQLHLSNKYVMPVSVIALFADGSEQYRPYTHLEQMPDAERGFDFKACKLMEQDPMEILPSRNLFSFIIQTIHLSMQKGVFSDYKIMEQAIRYIKELQPRKMIFREKLAMMLFIQAYMTFSNPQYQSRFRNLSKLIILKTKNMNIIDYLKTEARLAGEIKGIEIGINKGKAILVANLLKNTDFNITTISRLAEVSFGFIKSVRRDIEEEERVLLEEGYILVPGS